MVAITVALSLFASIAATRAVPMLEKRQSITTLSTSQISAFKPYSYYASAAYCKPANTLAWNCGTNCQANSGFKPIASGGDGASVQYCKYAWDQF